MSEATKQPRPPSTREQVADQLAEAPRYAQQADGLRRQLAAARERVDAQGAA